MSGGDWDFDENQKQYRNDLVGLLDCPVLAEVANKTLDRHAIPFSNCLRDDCFPTNYLRFGGTAIFHMDLIFLVPNACPIR